MHDALHITEMLATRLCHDLTGPIGAVSNGAELLEDGGASMLDDALALITSSAEEAVYRIQFYRQAYGRTSVVNDVSLAEKKELIDNFLSHSKIDVLWKNETAMQHSVSSYVAKLLLNAVIIGSATLIRGGEITIDVHNEGADIHVEARGQTVKLDEELLNALQRNTPVRDLTPKSVQPYLMWEAADSIGAMVNFDLQPDFFSLHISKPQDIS